MQRAWNNKSLERLSETPRREAQDSASNCSSRNETRRRSASSDTIAYLQEKCEKGFQLREDELKLRREELELKKSRRTLFCQQNQVLMTVLGMLADKTWKKNWDLQRLTINFIYCLCFWTFNKSRGQL